MSSVSRQSTEDTVVLLSACLHFLGDPLSISNALKTAVSCLLSVSVLCSFDCFKCNGNLPVLFCLFACLDLLLLLVFFFPIV